jgi:hypothetical protein
MRALGHQPNSGRTASIAAVFSFWLGQSKWPIRGKWRHRSRSGGLSFLKCRFETHSELLAQLAIARVSVTPGVAVRQLRRGIIAAAFGSKPRSTRFSGCCRACSGARPLLSFAQSCVLPRGGATIRGGKRGDGDARIDLPSRLRLYRTRATSSHFPLRQRSHQQNDGGRGPRDRMRPDRGYRHRPPGFFRTRRCCAGRLSRDLEPRATRPRIRWTI